MFISMKKMFITWGIVAILYIPLMYFFTGNLVVVFSILIFPTIVHLLNQLRKVNIPYKDQSNFRAIAFLSLYIFLIIMSVNGKVIPCILSLVIYYLMHKIPFNYHLKGDLVKQKLKEKGVKVIDLEETLYEYEYIISFNLSAFKDYVYRSPFKIEIKNQFDEKERFIINSKKTEIHGYSEKDKEMIKKILKAIEETIRYLISEKEPKYRLLFLTEKREITFEYDYVIKKDIFGIDE